MGGGNSRDRRKLQRLVQKILGGLTIPPVQSKAPSPTAEKHLWQRLLDFIEQPLVTLPLGIIGGLVGLLVYAPILVLCGSCIVLGFHRAKVVAGYPKLRVQLPIYLLVSMFIGLALYGLQAFIQSKLREENISLMGSFKSAVREILPKAEIQPQLSPPLKPADARLEAAAPIFSDDEGLVFKIRVTNAGDLPIVGMVHIASIDVTSGELWPATRENG